MPTCPYYQQDRRSIASNAMHGRGGKAALVVVPYCTHHYSPFPLKDSHGMGAALALRCGGDLEACQVPPDKFDEP